MFKRRSFCSTFTLQPADRGVSVFVNPGPRHRRHLRQIDSSGNAAHSARTSSRTARLLMATLYDEPEGQTVADLNRDNAISQSDNLTK